MVSRRLRVQPTSIYWYFHTKDDLLDAMTERALRHHMIALPAPVIPAGRWRETLADHARTIRRLFLANPVLCDLVLIRAPLSRRAVRMGAEHLERTVAGLVAAGLRSTMRSRSARRSIFTSALPLSCNGSRIRTSDLISAGLTPSPASTRRRLRCSPPPSIGDTTRLPQTSTASKSDSDRSSAGRRPARKRVIPIRSRSGGLENSAENLPTNITVCITVILAITAAPRGGRCADTPSTRRPTNSLSADPATHRRAVGRPATHRLVVLITAGTDRQIRGPRRPLVRYITRFEESPCEFPFPAPLPRASAWSWSRPPP
ncbi:TetR/AcrR family transcriptional regulator [Nocardia abscessus]|uniref:TetR/AcrR family transcriptional regulator n=1 Tax=Nocardia abscessus TaxID=120957 RepID=UPI003CC7D8B7